MAGAGNRRTELDLLWRLRFGEPPPVRASPEQTRRVLETYAHHPSPRLCVEAQALEQDAARACAELQDVRLRSKRLLEEARALAGLRA